MNDLFPVTVAIGLLVAPHVSRAHEDTNCILLVRVYNYAGLDKRILSGTQRQAESILSRAGVKTRWIECAVSTEQSRTDSGCNKPLAGPEVVLKLLSDSMARKTNQPGDTFGFAVPTSPVGIGSVSVFVRRAEQLALSGPFPAGYDAARTVVLGHLIVHEIGHLLLGAGSHSRTGIMSFPWSHAHVKQIATSQLAFTDPEAEMIRDRLTSGDRKR